jgi:hypothetical protein
MKRRAFLQVSGAAFAGLMLEALPERLVRLLEAADAPFARTLAADRSKTAA